MKIKSVEPLLLKYPECDITTKNQNFFIKTGGSYILTHNSPALFILIDPRTGTLGVSTKSIGAKAQKIYHSPKELKDVAPGLKEKLEVALSVLRKLPMGGHAFQGDVLFTKSDVKKRRIKGKDYLTFKPNVLMYAVAVDADSELYRKVANSEFGIVLHTVYDVEVVEGSLQLNYTKNDQALYDVVEKGQNTPGLFITHPHHSQITLDVAEDDIVKVEKLLMNLDKIKYKAPSGKIRDYFNQFVNTQIRKTGLVAGDAPKLLADFDDYLEGKKAEEMNKRKTDKGKESVEAAFDEIKEEAHQAAFTNFLRVYVLAVEIKAVFLSVFGKVHSKIGETFFEKGEDLESTGPEGFVIASGDGGIVKLVDRGVFSRTNFLFGAFNK